MKKAIKVIGTMLIVVVMITSCSGGDYMNNEVEEVTDTRIEVSYEKFNGEREYTLSVKEEPYIFFEIETNAGNLDLQIYEKGDRETPVYETTELLTVSISIDVEANKEYDIVLTAEEHEGSFLFYSM